MFPVDPSALVEAGQHAVKKTAVNLHKSYRGLRDVIYSGDLSRIPKVPTFEQEDEA